MSHACLYRAPHTGGRDGRSSCETAGRVGAPRLRWMLLAPRYLDGSAAPVPRNSSSLSSAPSLSLLTPSGTSQLRTSDAEAPPSLPICCEGGFARLLVRRCAAALTSGAAAAAALARPLRSLFRRASAASLLEDTDRQVCDWTPLSAVGRGRFGCGACAHLLGHMAARGGGHGGAIGGGTTAPPPCCTRGCCCRSQAGIAATPSGGGAAAAEAQPALPTTCGACPSCWVSSGRSRPSCPSGMSTCIGAAPTPASAERGSTTCDAAGGPPAVCCCSSCCGCCGGHCCGCCCGLCCGQCGCCCVHCGCCS